VYANRGHKFHIGDVADAHFIDTIFQIERPDIVIHGAAESHVDDSISSANPFIMSNVLGTQVMVDASVKYDVEKFIYVSTDEVYGQLASEGDEPWTESSALAPRNPYSASKAAGELIVEAANATHGLQYNTTRSCNNYGPRQSTKNLIPKIIRNILRKEKIPIYGQGQQLREWIHVADNCRAVLSIMRNAPSNEAYNISAGYETSNLELVNEICNIMGTGHDLISFVEDRKGHDFRYAMENSKLKSLGWEPSFKFKKGLDHCIKWYINNRWFMNLNM
jgi:dTDP-glucose 4,6-dehydratase